jgi:hypothetical protein
MKNYIGGKKVSQVSGELIKIGLLITNGSTIDVLECPYCDSTDISDFPGNTQICNRCHGEMSLPDGWSFL